MRRQGLAVTRSGYGLQHLEICHQEISLRANRVEKWGSGHHGKSPSEEFFSCLLTTLFLELFVSVTHRGRHPKAHIGHLPRFIRPPCRAVGHAGFADGGAWARGRRCGRAAGCRPCSAESGVHTARRRCPLIGSGVVGGVGSGCDWRVGRGGALFDVHFGVGRPAARISARILTRPADAGEGRGGQK